jgi:hypothetical protein
MTGADGSSIYGMALTFFEDLSLIEESIVEADRMYQKTFSPKQNKLQEESMGP